MDPRIAPPKPHRGYRQEARRSQRRYIPRSVALNPLRYIPPPELHQSAYPQNSYNGPSNDTYYPNARMSVESGSYMHSRDGSLRFSQYGDRSYSQNRVPLPVNKTMHQASEESHGLCISQDYVPDRGVMLWSRWILSLLCLGQLISAFAVICCHAVDYSEDTPLEVGLSLGLLVSGNIFATGIVTIILYYRRWHREATRARSKAVEANHEVWICTRAAFSLIGMAPIARYIELFSVYRRLERFEREHKNLLENNTPSNYTNSYHPDSVLQSPPPSEAISSENREKLYRLRRLFIQLDFDACVVGLANSSLGAAPFTIAQGVLYFRRLLLNRLMPNSTAGAILASFVFSVLWLTAAACQFQPDVHYINPNDLVHLPANKHVHIVSAGGRVVLFFARLVHITIRMLTFSLFAGLFDWILGVVVVVHWLFYLAMLLFYRGSTDITAPAYKANPRYRRPLDQRLKTKGVLRHLGTDLLYTYVSVFDFFNGSAGKTRLRCILYYFAFYLENSALIGAWYSAYPFTASWYYLPALLVIVTVQWSGAIFLQFYFFYFSSSPRGTSLCGLCCPDELRGPVELIYSPPPPPPSVQVAQPLSPHQQMDTPSFVVASTSLYARKSLSQTQGSDPRTLGSDSLTRITTELPRKPRSRYLYVRDSQMGDDGEIMDDWREWDGVETTVLGGGSNI